MPRDEPRKSQAAPPSGRRRALTTALACLAWAVAAIAPAGCSSEAAEPGAARASADEFPASHYFPNRSAGMMAMEGRPAPPLATGQWYGEPQALGDLEGKVVVVDFWATWCGPCLRAIPHNVELVKTRGDQGLVVIGVHDAARGADRIPQAIEQFDMNYPVAVDAPGQDSVRAWNVRFWPSYFVLDRRGIVRAAGIHPGALEDVVGKLLGESQ